MSKVMDVLTDDGSVRRPSDGLIHCEIKHLNAGTRDLICRYQLTVLTADPCVSAVFAVDMSGHAKESTRRAAFDAAVEGLGFTRESEWICGSPIWEAGVSNVQ